MYNRPLKFRVWDKKLKKMISWNSFIRFDDPEYEVMQYIDNVDMHKKEIYEGDIVKVSARGFRKDVVSVYKGQYIFADLDQAVTDFYENELEIVGNIFENPEIKF